MDTILKFKRSWLVFNCVGFFVGSTIAAFLTVILALFLAPSNLPFVSFLGGIAGFIFGTAVGSAQYFVLRNKLSLPPLLWIVPCSVGWTIGLLFHLFIFPDLTTGPIQWSPVGWAVVGGLLAGAIIGVFQAVGLRKIVLQARGWILANIIAGPLVGILLIIPILLAFADFFIPDTAQESEFHFFAFVVLVGGCMLVGALAGLIQGLITWIPLRKVLQELSNGNTPVS